MKTPPHPPIAPKSLTANTNPHSSAQSPAASSAAVPKQSKRKSAPPTMLTDNSNSKQSPDLQHRKSDADPKKLEMAAIAKLHEKYVLEAVIRDYYAPCCIIFDCVPGRKSQAFDSTTYEDYSADIEPLIQLCADRSQSEAMLVRSLFVLDNSHTSQTHKVYYYSDIM